MPPRAAAKQQPQITLQRIGRVTLSIPIQGLTPLIANKFSAKAQSMMLAKQMGEVVQREHKNPEELFRNAAHLIAEGRPGAPAVAFKGAIVDAARFFPGQKLTMESLKRTIFVHGESGEDGDLLVPLYGEWTGDPAALKPAEAVMRQDYARNETGVADIRFRPQYDPWSAILNVTYPPTLYKSDTIIALVDAAGMSGIGEWRPGSKESKTGSYGTFAVPADASITVVTL
jgi:hypothetical protein